MISAHHRLLLQRQLANNAPTTMAKTHLRKSSSINGYSPASFATGRHHQSLGGCRSMSYNPHYNHATASSVMVHLHVRASSFSSPAATVTDEQQTTTSEIGVNNAIEKGAILKDNAATTCVPPTNDENNEVATANSSSLFSGDDIIASLIKSEGDPPPPLELVSGEGIADTTTISPENVIRTGKIEWIE